MEGRDERAPVRADQRVAGRRRRPRPPGRRQLSRSRSRGPEYTFRGSIGAYDTADRARRRGTSTRHRTTRRAAPASASGRRPRSTPGAACSTSGTGNTYSEPTAPLADSILAIDYQTGELEWSRSSPLPTCSAPATPPARTPTSALRRTCGRRTGATSSAPATRPASTTRSTARRVRSSGRRTLTPGSFFGGEIGSARVRRRQARRRLERRRSRRPTRRRTWHKVFALDPATGEVLWEAEDFAGKIFAPVSAVPGVAFVGTDTGLLAALDTQTGRRLWTHQAPARTGCGPSIVDGRVLWGYGFTCSAAGRGWRHQLHGGSGSMSRRVRHPAIRALVAAVAIGLLPAGERVAERRRCGARPAPRTPRRCDRLGASAGCGHAPVPPGVIGADDDVGWRRAPVPAHRARGLRRRRAAPGRVGSARADRQPPVRAPA